MADGLKEAMALEHARADVLDAYEREAWRDLEGVLSTMVRLAAGDVRESAWQSVQSRMELLLNIEGLRYHIRERLRPGPQIPSPSST